MSRLLEIKLKEFNVDATVVAVQPGPVITRFEIQPAAGVKVARITNIAKDLARAMAMVSVRVVEVIPGKLDAISLNTMYVAVRRQCSEPFSNLLPGTSSRPTRLSTAAQ